MTGIPARYFIDWAQGLFNKKDERAYPINIKYRLDQYVPGLDVGYRYIYGDHFKTANQDNREIERDVVLNYVGSSEPVKGLGFQLLHVDYRARVGKSYDEVRFLTRYSVHF